MRIPILIILLLAAVVHAQDEIVSLTDWRVKEGDDALWAAPDFDDGSWPSSGPPLARPANAVGRTNPVLVTWYRTRYRIPEQWRGHALALGVWKLDDAYEVFAGGRKIGSFGSMPAPGTGDHWMVSTDPYRRKFFRIPLDVSRDGEVLIAIRRWRMPVAISWEVNEVSPIAGSPPPVIGLAAAVELEHRVLTGNFYLRGAPGMLAWLATIACGLLCLAIRRRREHLELLWVGLALLASGAHWGLSLPMALAEWPAKNSLPVFVWTLTTLAASDMFFGWFLAELIPEWRRGLRWASVAVALGMVAPLITSQFWFPPWDVTIGLRRASRVLQFAMILAAAGRIWQPGRRELLAVVLTVALRAAVAVATNISNYANYHQVGPFLFSLRRTSDAVIALAIASLLYVRARREQARRQDLERDLEAARRVQETLLGAVDAEVAAGFSAEAVYVPAREVGGDFYQVLRGADGSLLVLVGDVSGKGLQAALLVSSVIGSLRNEFSRSPKEVLHHLNRSLHGQTAGGFVTCCCTRFGADGAITAANAGHIPPYADGCELAMDAGLPLGIDMDADYSESLLNGDRFVFLSDGVVEAADARGELFGFDRTRAISTKSAREIADAARAWGQNDDITVVTVRRCG